MENKQLINRMPAVAGRFYPDNKNQLEEELLQLFSRAKQPVLSNCAPQAIIVPHAGYVFSGKVAASAFNQIPENYCPDRVFVLASSHHTSFTGASVYCQGNYKTPLGLVPVDMEYCRRLVQSNNIFTDWPDVHLNEHSLEVQLPFLQMKLSVNTRYVPIILGLLQPEDCHVLAQALEPCFVPGNLFIISSDFSHYPCFNDAVAVDRETTEAILNNLPGKLLETLEENRLKKIKGLSTSLCGWTSVLTLMYLTEGKNYDYHWIDYQNSGHNQLYGDQNRVVGYSAIAIYNEKSESFSLTAEEKHQLIDIAIESAKSTLTTGKKTHPDGRLFLGNLALPAGAFVSLYVKHKLRGCIGSFSGENTLAETVSRMAASATHDHRFEQIKAEELDELSVEISVLTPLKKITSSAEIELGKHGIYIKKGSSSGTFLPQVAEKFNFNLDEFLGRCSRDKAGLGWNGWKNAELFTYEAIIFAGP